MGAKPFVNQETRLKSSRVYVMFISRIFNSIVRVVDYAETPRRGPAASDAPIRVIGTGAQVVRKPQDRA